MGIAFLQPVEVQQIDRPFQALALLALGGSLHAQGKDDVLGHLLVGEQQEVLEHHADAPGVGRRVGHVLAVDHDAAAVGGLEPGDDAQQRGLARAAGPEQGEELVPADFQRDGIDGGYRSEALGGAFDQQDVLGHGPRPGRTVYGKSGRRPRALAGPASLTWFALRRPRPRTRRAPTSRARRVGRTCAGRAAPPCGRASAGRRPPWTACRSHRSRAIR